MRRSPTASSASGGAEAGGSGRGASGAGETGAVGGGAGGTAAGQAGGREATAAGSGGGGAGAAGGIAGAVAGTGAAPAAGSAGQPPTGTGAATGCSPAASADAKGPWTATHLTGAGPSGGSWVFYPQELGQSSVRHPVFTWAAGAGLAPSQYTDHLDQLASHGFVVISQPFSSDGSSEKAALDWILAENLRTGSPFYQKLDAQRVGAGGHSAGALATIAMADDPRLKLYVLACGGSMSAGSSAGKFHAPSILLGVTGEGATMNFENDYAVIQTPVVFTSRATGDHASCPRQNLAPWVAFMRWQFCGETQLEASFRAGGTYCSAPWTCKSKGF